MLDLQKIIDLRPSGLDPNDIDLSAGTYCMSFAFDLDLLVRSVREGGLVNTPLVWEGPHQRYLPITGYRRILALRTLVWKSIPCRILKCTEISPLDCLLTNLHENLTIRKFNDVEKGMVLRRLMGELSEEEIVEHYLPLLDLPRREASLHFYVAIEKDLDQEIKISLARREISLPVVKWLLPMEPASRMQVFHFLKKLNLNFNQQQKCIDYIEDISTIENSSISQLLPELALEPTTDLNRPQKARSILQDLRRRRFPRLVQAEKTFKKRVSRLDLPSGVRIDAPAHFEGPNYRMEVLFKDGRELREKMESLSHADALEELGDPWKGNPS